MACKTGSRDFKNQAGDDVTVFVRQLPATKALDLQIELLNVMGADVFPFINGDFDFGNLVRVMTVTQHDKLSEIIKRTVCLANRDGKEVSLAEFNSVYNGDLMLVCKVFAFVCEVNFKDFFVQGLEMNEQKRLAVDCQSNSEELK